MSIRELNEAKEGQKPFMRRHTVLCPQCQHPIVSDHVRALLPRMQGRLFDIISAAGQAGIGSEDVMRLWYADDPSGGPEGTNIVSVQAHQVNLKIAHFGLKLKSARGPGSVWRLIPVTPPGEVDGE